MTCQMCGGDTKVVDTARSSTEIIRRRKCLNCDCDFIFHTIEIITDRKVGARLLEKFKKASRL